MFVDLLHSVAIFPSRSDLTNRIPFIRSLRDGNTIAHLVFLQTLGRYTTKTLRYSFKISQFFTNRLYPLIAEARPKSGPFQTAHDADSRIQNIQLSLDKGQGIYGQIPVFQPIQVPPIGSASRQFLSFLKTDHQDNPCNQSMLHISSIKIWKAKHFFKHSMKAGTICDPRRININAHHDFNALGLYPNKADNGSDR